MKTIVSGGESLSEMHTTWPLTYCACESLHAMCIRYEPSLNHVQLLGVMISHNTVTQDS